MGIRNLHCFLKKKCPHIYNKIPLHKYAFRKIAIDLSIYMCKFKTIYGKNWLDAFVKLIILLRKNDIHFAFVYDSKAPPEKDEERKSRSEARAKNKDRVIKLQSLWDEFKTIHLNENLTLDLKEVDNEILYSFIKKIQEQKIVMESLQTEDNISYHYIDEELQKLQNSIFTISSEDFEMTKKLFQICKIPIVIAAGEAEATCASLNVLEKVSGVLTDDTDILAYGSPIMLHKIQIEDDTVIEIDYNEILDSLKLTADQFLDFCIMCGTDYNPNLPKIGPDRSYKMILQYGSLENIETAFKELPIHLLNYKRVREIFKMKIGFDSEIPFCGFPDIENLRSFCFIHNVKINIDSIVSAFCTSSFHQFISLDDEKINREDEKKKSILLLLNKKV